MSILSQTTLDKAQNINKFKLQSPVGRTSTKTGEVLDITVYFIGKANKDGAPAKGADAWTPNAQDAEKLGINVGPMPANVNLDGTRYYWKDGVLDDSELEAIKHVKGMQKGNRIALDAKALKKALNSTYILGLPEKERRILFDFVSNELAAAEAIAFNTGDDKKEEEALFSY